MGPRWQRVLRWGHTRTCWHCRQQPVIWPDLLQEKSRGTWREARQRSRNHSRRHRGRAPSRSPPQDKLALRMNPSPGDAESTTFQWGRCCHSPHSERDESRHLQEKIKSKLLLPACRQSNNRPKMCGEIKTKKKTPLIGPIIQMKSQQIKQ